MVVTLQVGSQIFRRELSSPVRDRNDQQRSRFDPGRGISNLKTAIAENSAKEVLATREKIYLSINCFKQFDMMVSGDRGRWSQRIWSPRSPDTCIPIILKHSMDTIPDLPKKISSFVQAGIETLFWGVGVHLYAIAVR